MQIVRDHRTAAGRRARARVSRGAAAGRAARGRLCQAVGIAAARVASSVTAHGIGTGPPGFASPTKLAKGGARLRDAAKHPS